MFKILVSTIVVLSFSVVHAEGLKKIDYQDKTIETKQTNNQAQVPTASPEQMEKIMKDVQKIKANQAEAKKYLDELDKE